MLGEGVGDAQGRANLEGQGPPRLRVEQKISALVGDVQ